MKVYVLSSAILVSGSPVMIGLAFTLISKLANDIGLAIMLSVTDTRISEVIPTSLLVGVPLNWPVVVSKLAQLGWFVMLYSRVSTVSTSAPVGVNKYPLSSLITVAGVPVIVGTSFTFITSKSKLANDTATFPSLIEIPILLVIPTWELSGVPLNSPVVVLKVAQLGLFVML